VRGCGAGITEIAELTVTTIAMISFHFVTTVPAYPMSLRAS